MRKVNSAFSLIELSIVILIIGILIAGVTAGGKLYYKAQLAIARSLTTSSPVNGIKDLMLWYETTSSNSFKSTQSSDGTAIDTWYDINSQQPIPNNATQTTTANQPLYKENIFANGIPAIRFDGTDDCMSFDGSFIANSSYTIFVVEQRRSAPSLNYGTPWVGGTSSSTVDANFHFGYASLAPSTAKLGHFTDDLNYVNSTLLTTFVTRMHTGSFNSSTLARKYWYNGGTTADSSDTAKAALSGWSGAAIARIITNYYNGDIGEIIFFARALTDEERQSVESYLSKKFNITIS